MRRCEGSMRKMRGSAGMRREEKGYKERRGTRTVCVCVCVCVCTRVHACVCKEMELKKV